ncbi:MAG TPA: quinone-dependent dihydroorotate dehydrogenase [Burkholderiales bacterium]|nr:quinone-dependent dihydroorotate dehydrogenase [Burkholderiales bacterium]
MPYALVRPLLFALDGETSHNLTMRSLNVMHNLRLTRLMQCNPRAKSKKLMGLTFPNAVGLAAGLDKDGAHIDALASLGFGFIEIGTVTPRPQPGNPKPRLFRIPEAEAIINRMGFNNGGVESLVENVKRSNFKGILGINIGKNFDTPIERAVDDYLICLNAVYPFASYVTVNISSPNTKNLRDLQSQDALDDLLGQLKTRRDSLTEQHRRRVPLVLKIAPDLDHEQIAAIAALLLKHGIDGVIATNTTLAREAVADLPNGNETGGLSGAPLRDRSNGVIQQLFQHLHGRIPIIGVGGVMNAEDARQKIDAGASLVQVYSGLIYRGPRLIPELVKAIC